MGGGRCWDGIFWTWAAERAGISPNKGTAMEPRELVEAWVEAFNRTDVDAVADFYAEDATNHQVAEEPIVHAPGHNVRPKANSANRDIPVKEHGWR